MNNQASFLEVGAPDAGRTRDFLHGLFGWRFEPVGGGFSTDDSGVSIGLHGGDDDRNMVVYFEVADIDAAIARVRALGGTAPDADAGDPRFGRFVECKDPDGVRFGLRQLPR
jgi:uncharacterized protein